MRGLCPQITNVKTMKKVFLFLTALAFSTSAVTAQDDGGSDKKLKFGLKLTPGLSWVKSDNEKDLIKDGTKLSFAWGGAVEINLGDNAAIVLGLEVTSFKYGLDYIDTAGYFFDSADEVIFEIDENGVPQDTANINNIDILLLNTRNLQANYITLPFAIKAKTNEIGYLTYFGQFGINTHINTKGRSEDNVKSLVSGTSSTLTDLNVDSEVTPIKFTLNIGIGAEYSLQGSTSLVVSLNYINGFTNILRGNSRHLIDKDGNRFKQTVFDRGLTLGVGILF